MLTLFQPSQGAHMLDSQFVHLTSEKMKERACMMAMPVTLLESWTSLLLHHAAA